MRARVKATGEIIDVSPKANPDALHSGDNLYECGGIVYRYWELDFLNDSNMETEDKKTEEIAKIAKAVFPMVISEKPGTTQDDPLYEDSSELKALLYLDSLLTWLTD